MPQEIRLDAVGKLGKVLRTSQGGARIPASLTRAGVLEYKDPSMPGGVRREWRPSSEVFRQDAIDALHSLPAIVGHSAWITPANYRQHTVGVVDAGSAKQRGGLLDGMVAVQDQEALRRIDAGELTDLSLGYSLEYKPGAGIVPQGEPDAGKRYDGVQTNLVANHVALLGPGKARAEVGFRFDSADALSGAPLFISDNAPEAQPQEEQAMALIVRLDSKEYDVATAQGALELQQACDKMRQERQDALDKCAKAEGKIEGLNATITRLETEAKDTSRLDSLVSERVDLETTAASLIGDKFTGKGKSNREIKIEVIRQDSKDFTGFEADGKTPKPDTFIDGRFDAVVENLPRHDSIHNLPTTVRTRRREDAHEEERDNERGNRRRDSGGPRMSASERARIANEERSRNAWMGQQQPSQDGQ